MRRSILLGCLALLLCGAAGGLAWRVWFAPNILTIAVGPPGSEDSRLIGAIAQHLLRDRDTVRLRVVPASDEADAAAILSSEGADLAVIRNDIALPAHAQTVAIMHRDAVVLVAPAGRGIATFGDLRGKTIGVLRRVEANTRILNAILAHYDMAPQAVRIVPLESGADAEAAFRAGTIDAALTVGTLTGRSARETVTAASVVSEGGSPVFVPIAEAEAIALETGIYDHMDIVRGSFGGATARPADPVRTLSVSHLLVASTSLEDGTIAELTRLLFAMRPTIARAIPLANRIEAPDTARGSVLPVHPGALSYYDNEVETFFDRYDDWIYLSIMGVSILGSGFAGLASTAAARRRARTLGLLDRLLGIVRLARLAESTAELDGLETETDDILGHALGKAGSGGLDDTGISAFSLGLDQARHAIAERRDVLEARDRVPLLGADGQPLPHVAAE